MRRLRVAILFLLLLGIVGWGIGQSEQSRAVFYSFLRARSRSQTLSGLSGYRRLDGEHVAVLYTARDADVAPLVLEAAEEVYGPVAQRLGLTPPNPVPVIVRPDRESLQRAFGWSSGENALGVYRTGVIQMLSPNAWLHVVNPGARQQTFFHLNPLAHELTHYVLDYATQGNYPRWFTEGLAQRVEHEITGYLWLDPAGSVKGRLYSLQEMTDDFDGLPNQALAYRESYLLVGYIVQRWGDAGLHRVVANLAAQRPFANAVEDATGLTPAGLETAWRGWVAANAGRLDEALTP